MARDVSWKYKKCTLFIFEDEFALSDVAVYYFVFFLTIRGNPSQVKLVRDSSFAAAEGTLGKRLKLPAGHGRLYPGRLVAPALFL